MFLPRNNINMSAICKINLLLWFINYIKRYLTNLAKLKNIKLRIKIVQQNVDIYLRAPSAQKEISVWKELKIGFRRPEEVFQCTGCKILIWPENLEELGIEFVDIGRDVNEEVLSFYDEADREKNPEKFRSKVKAFFMPHCTLGTEYGAQGCKRDESAGTPGGAPGMKESDEDGIRRVTASADCLLPVGPAQIFVSPLVIIYDKPCWPDGSGIWERWVCNFLAVCNVVDVVCHTRILADRSPDLFDLVHYVMNIWKINIASPIPMLEPTVEMMKEEGEEGPVKSSCLEAGLPAHVWIRWGKNQTGVRACQCGSWRSRWKPGW